MRFLGIGQGVNSMVELFFIPAEHVDSSHVESFVDSRIL